MLAALSGTLGCASNRMTVRMPAQSTSLHVIGVDVPYQGSMLYVLNDGKPHPGVLLLHGSEGGATAFFRIDAEYLASQGFAAMAFCYFDCDGGSFSGAGQPLMNLPLDQTAKALHWLKNSPYVQGMKTALYGASRGSEQAMILATLLAQSPDNPDAIATHANIDVVVGAVDDDWEDRKCWLCKDGKNNCFPPGKRFRAWDFTLMSWNPSCGATPPENFPNYKGVPAWTWQGNPIVPGLRIEIEKYKGPIFMTQGTADQTWNVVHTKNIEKTLADAGNAPEVHYFDGEGHQFGTPAENTRLEFLTEFLTRALSSK